MTDAELHAWLTSRGACHGIVHLQATIAELRGRPIEQVEAWWRGLNRAAHTSPE